MYADLHLDDVVISRMDFDPEIIIVVRMCLSCVFVGRARRGGCDRLPVFFFFSVFYPIFRVFLVVIQVFVWGCFPVMAGIHRRSSPARRRLRVSLRSVYQAGFRDVFSGSRWCDIWESVTLPGGTGVLQVPQGDCTF